MSQRVFLPMPGASAAIVLALLSGCAPDGRQQAAAFGAEPARSTRLRSSDLDLTIATTVQQLAASPFMTGRNASSPVVRLVPRGLENQSSDRISVADQWVAVSRILFDPGMQRLLGEKNIILQMPPDEMVRVRRVSGLVAPGSVDLRADPEPATHIIKAVIRSMTRVGSETSTNSNQRKETFVVTYEITDVATRQIVWAGESTFARIAHGLVAD